MNEAEQIVYDLLELRAKELKNDLIIDVCYTDEYMLGYKDGYMNLLKDIQNLMQCGYIKENTVELKEIEKKA